MRVKEGPSFYKGRFVLMTRVKWRLAYLLENRYPEHSREDAVEEFTQLVEPKENHKPRLERVRLDHPWTGGSQSLWFYHLGLFSMRQEVQRVVEGMPEGSCKEIDYRELVKIALDDEAWSATVPSEAEDGMSVATEVCEESMTGGHEDTTTGVSHAPNPCGSALDVPPGSPDRPAYNGAILSVIDR